LRIVSARRPNSTAPNTSRIISVERNAATFPPEMAKYSTAAAMPAAAATRFTGTRVARPSQPDSSNRSTANTPPATIVRCRPDTDSTCAMPAVAIVSRAPSVTALWSPLMIARAMPAAGCPSDASMRAEIPRRTASITCSGVASLPARTIAGDRVVLP